MKNKIHLVLMIFMLNGCGTDTGNPSLTTPVNSSSPLMDYIGYSLCSKIQSCFMPSLTNCEIKIRTSPQLPTKLGLNESIYPNFQSIQTAINNQTLQIDENKKLLCLQSLKQISCYDGNIQQSYSSNSVEDLSQIWKMLNVDSACGQFIY